MGEAEQDQPDRGSPARLQGWDLAREGAEGCWHGGNRVAGQTTWLDK